MEDRNNKETSEDQLLYIMVVGFHHKKGCQLEYVYPSGGENDKRIRRITTVDSSSEGELYKLPKRWRHLPSLALPDGSHNYTTDYIYFHLEDDEDEEADEEVVENENGRNNSGSVDESAKQKGKRLSPRQTIFGVSCYRQINASELIIKEVDVTRNTLQKSVCILSREPVYASLRLKLQSITSAYFEQKDFRRTSILATAFESLRKTYRTRAPRRAVGAPQSLVSQQRLISSPAFPTMPRSGGHVIEDDSEQRSRYLTGLSLGELVLRYQHKILVLFKLMLLQKKCLFQIKPVSNLSNTIMALVSLMPDIFLPSAASSNDGKVSGLHSAAGFFDSLDLINSELERKNLKRRKAAAAAAENRTSTDLEANISLAKIKKNKKKFMSFSKRKQQHYQQQLRKQQQQQQQQQYQNGATNSTASISSSYSSHSLKSPPQIKPIDAAVPQSPTTTTATATTAASPSLFNMISQNTQKFFSFQTATNQSGPVTNTTTNLAGSDSDLYNKLSNEDEDDVDVVKSKQQLQLHLNHDQDDVESDFVLTAANGADGEIKQPTATIESPVGTVGELLKSRMSDVFKLVDWSSPIVHTATTTSSSKQFSTPSPPANQQESSSTSPSTTTSSSANNSSMRRSESSSISSSKTATNTNPGGVQTTPSSTGSRHRQEIGGGGGEIQLAELLDHEMGMPLPLFDEFNVLHPYLSLYYLDYFTAINKMNTKLFCTTTLMMSMLTQNSQKSREEQQGEEVVDTESGTTVPPAAPFDPTRPRQADVNCPLGYTIGATNALFKQRLYDDIDAFVDEVDVDLKANETLKKQLQLSTADLRFTDYIIKNVQANREKQQQQQSQSSAKLISIKKTSSSNTFNPNKSSSEYNIDEENSPSSPNSSPTMTTVEFEGSDDWIRLNFKWYLYTMLASIVREEACARLKLELENLIFSSAAASFSSSSSSAASSASHSGGDNSSSAGSTSLENEVVNIDDYIDRVTNTTKTPSNGSPVVRRVARRGSEKNKGDPNTTTPTKFDTTTPRKKKHGSKKELSSRKNSSSSSSNGSLSSIHYYNLIQQINTYSNYREDFNSHFVSEFKRTECYRRWQETNKSRIEKSLFNFTPTVTTAATTTAPIAPTASVSSTSLTTNATFQWTLTQLQEIDNRRVTHPFNGQLGVNDIRLRFSFLFANSESGRKFNRALEEGGRLVNSTGKAVGSVLNSAKSTFSSLISNWSNSTGNTNSYSSSSPSSPSSASSKSKSNTKM